MADGLSTSGLDPNLRNRILQAVAQFYSGGQAQAAEASPQPSAQQQFGPQAPMQSNIQPGAFQTPPGALTGNGAPGGAPPPAQPSPAAPPAAPPAQSAPGAGQQALMARGQPQPRQPFQGGGMGGGAMPFMGGAMGGGGAAQRPQQPSQRFWASAPDIPPAPTIDDALYAVEKMSQQGMFRFGHGSGLDDHSQAVYQVFDQLNNQYKADVAAKLGVQKNNVEQAGQLNAQQAELSGQQNQRMAFQDKANQEQWGRAMDVAQFGQRQRQESGKLAFENKRLDVQNKAEQRRLEFDQSKESREKVDAARKLLADAKDRLANADKGSESGYFSKATPKSDDAKLAEKDIADAEAVIRGAGGGGKAPKAKSEDQPAGDAAWKTRQIENAKKAIASGIPRDQVIKALQEHGIDHSGQGL